MEHTKDPRMAAEIAKDHLTEDPGYYDKLFNAGLADELGKDSGIVEPNVKSVDKQTTPGTVYPEVPNDPSKGPDMVGCIGSTKGMDPKSNIDGSAKDPQPTDHITGKMGSTPTNTNILQKQAGADTKPGDVMQTMMQAVIPKDISIDIAESKKLLGKLKTESYFSRPIPEKNYEALQDKRGRWIVYKHTEQGVLQAMSGPLNKEQAFNVESTLNSKESEKVYGMDEMTPVAGDPDTDPNFVDGKRWTVKLGN